MTTDRVFTFLAAATSRQTEYKYFHHHAFMPRARVVERRGRYYLEVTSAGQTVAVEKAW